MNWALSDMAEVLGETWSGSDRICRGVSIDSRTLHEQDLFVALRGPNFDGADYIQAAADAGASGVLTDRVADANIAQIQVPDTLSALHALATAFRAKFNPTTIGITGSNGKTTMRALIAGLCGESTHATRGNLNNHLGVPLVLFGLESDHEFAVIEMGANHVGEIAALAALAQPTIGIVTNAGPAHLEGFGSLDGVAKGKGEMFAALTENDVAVINRDDRYYDYWCGVATPARVLTFGASDSADFWYSDYQTHGDGCRFRLHHDAQTLDIQLQLGGEHNAMNAAGACACATAAGVHWNVMAERFAGVEPVDGRQVPIEIARGITVIDDSYNANPASMRAAVDGLSAWSDKRWMVVGDMLELGSESMEQHEALGRYCRDAGVTGLFAIGEFASAVSAGFGAGAREFDDIEGLVEALEQALPDGAVVCVKGSRGSRMERVVQELERRL